MDEMDEKAFASFFASLGMPPVDNPPHPSLFDEISALCLIEAEGAEARESHSSVWHFRASSLADAVSPLWRSLPPRLLSPGLAMSVISPSITEWTLVALETGRGAGLAEYLRILPGFGGCLRGPLAGPAADAHAYVAMQLIRHISDDPEIREACFRPDPNVAAAFLHHRLDACAKPCPASDSGDLAASL